GRPLLEFGRCYGLFDIAQGSSFPVAPRRASWSKHGAAQQTGIGDSSLRCADSNSHHARKLSHEFSRTEIERFFNCRSFRSLMLSLRALARQRISFDDGRACTATAHWSKQTAFARDVI
ncbi:hypothetical protein, partial [Bradyrhizobium sp.]|uniref:hypothetical protein n=1 Tax=Bradyrhizobium sp. TaxID=376 RepID=UPI0025BD90AA